MAWQSDLVTMVRVLIGDLDTVPTFDDDRISQTLIVSAIIVQNEYPYFNQSYTLDLSAVDISPDPTEPATPEPLAVGLFSLKAACILNTNAYQKAVSSGIRVKDGDSEVDTTSGFKGYKDILLLGPCGAYEKLLRERMFRAGMNQGKAVMSPVARGGGGSPPWGRHYVNEFFDFLMLRG